MRVYLRLHAASAALCRCISRSGLASGSEPATLKSRAFRVELVRATISGALASAEGCEDFCEFGCRCPYRPMIASCQRTKGLRRVHQEGSLDLIRPLGQVLLGALSAEESCNDLTNQRSLAPPGRVDVTVISGPLGPKAQPLERSEASCHGRSGKQPSFSGSSFSEEPSTPLWVLAELYWLQSLLGGDRELPLAVGWPLIHVAVAFPRGNEGIERPTAGRRKLRCRSTRSPAGPGARSRSGRQPPPAERDGAGAMPCMLAPRSAVPRLHRLSQCDSF